MSPNARGILRRRLRPPSRPPGRDRAMAYAYGVQAGNLVFVSGQLATDASGALVGGTDVEAQAMKCFENVESVIAEAGGTRADIVKISVHLAQASYLEAMQRARRRFFTDPDFPASIAVFGPLVKPEYLVEIEAIAVLEPR